jgi:hypothetical protein
MDDLSASRRLALLGAVYAFLATGFLFVTPENLDRLHTALDASACILAAIAASQVLGMSRRERSRLGWFVGLTLCAAAAGWRATRPSWRSSCSTAIVPT